MISEEEIMKLVRNYAKSKEGRERIKKEYNIDYKDRIHGGYSKKEIGEEMKAILAKHIAAAIGSVTIDDIYVTEDKYGNISVCLKEWDLQRNSLIPGNPGIKNIVLLFSRGYDAKGAVHGVWKKRTTGEEVETWSLRHRDPNDFMERAVEEFNQKYKGLARAELQGKYQKGRKDY